jgi:NADPH:quinone reductase
MPTPSLQLRSTLRADGQIELSLVEVPVPVPGADEVVVRVEGAPINPSDLGLLLGPVEASSLKAGGTAQRPTLVGQLSPKVMPAFAARVGQSMPVGNEGAGEVVAAGARPEAQALLGKRVAVFGGAMYAQHRSAKAAEVLVLPTGASAAQGASAFVNPLTALAMVETLRREGHTALVHTAAASSLGQMLLRVCLADGVPLVNVVRRADQAKRLRELGAKHVVDSSEAGFAEQLTEAIAATGATLAFDAIGGGSLAGQILLSMERALARQNTQYSRYGTSTHKQVYVYGGLDRAPIQLPQGFGMAWGVGGWLIMPQLAKLGAEGAARLRRRIGDELTTTFATTYGRVISLSDVLQPAVAAGYLARATGEKYLIDPSKG